MIFLCNIIRLAILSWFTKKVLPKEEKENSFNIENHGTIGTMINIKEHKGDLHL